jgi:K+-transporting ATPase KdpF subunit
MSLPVVLGAMSGADVFGLAVSVVVFVYLIYALVRGERF